MIVLTRKIVLAASLVLATTPVFAGQWKIGGVEIGAGSFDFKGPVKIPSVNDIKREASNAGRQAQDAVRNADRELNNFDRQRLDAQRDLERKYYEARQKVNETTSHTTNRARVQESLREGGWQVAFGKEVDYKDYYLFSQAIGASIASGNPGPAAAYLKLMVVQTKAELTRNLSRQGSQLLADLEMRLVTALNEAIKTGRITEFTLDGVDVKMGLVSYNHSKKVSGHYPKIDKGTLTWEYMENKTPLPNTHQPYVAYRVRLRSNAGRQVVDSGILRGINQAGDVYNRAQNARQQVQDRSEQFNNARRSIEGGNLDDEINARIRQEADRRIDRQYRETQQRVGRQNGLVAEPAGPAISPGVPTPSPAGSGGQFAQNLGISYVPVSYGDGTFGARLIAPPTPNTAAAGLGLEPGDVVFALDGQRFRSPADVLNHQQQTTIDFIDVRTGQRRSDVIILP